MLKWYIYNSGIKGGSQYDAQMTQYKGLTLMCKDRLNFYSSIVSRMSEQLLSNRLHFLSVQHNYFY